MKRLGMAALLLPISAVALAGGNARTTMEVSFVIRAACSVQADANGVPQVACSQGTGYQLVRQIGAAARDAAPAQERARAARVGDAWQVVF